MEILLVIISYLMMNMKATDTGRISKVTPEFIAGMALQSTYKDYQT